ncbi:hypothetical protein FKR81_18775 [Lentzea tibetensis]|uniref:Thiopeptide-type bacteriocin biosynthesis domain-containing protein n=1 Tax=Lentzea tibetensis TaxID=2591470 RepID=A0A563ESL0_9PSEU|nr:thiopeptide-type bacteriocin biosynthesis protein [Lentzea tibetensis]TWP50659.1 hypothetical protein FKR81_18775 [Lentzea tibetensis]
MNTWLAATLHASPSRHDALLVEHLPRLLETLPDGVDRWFFSRGTDTLDLRFRPVSRSLRLHLLLWGMDVLDDGSARRMTLEAHRDDFRGLGGPATAEAATELFHADSNAVLTQLRLAHAGVLTIPPARLAALAAADLTRTWYGGRAEAGAAGPPQQMALLAPWWKRRAEVARVYSRVVAWLDPALVPPVLAHVLRQHRLRLASVQPAPERVTAQQA